jgi:hypothetical protein
MIDVKELLEEIKDNPYEKIDITAPHCGVVEFALDKPGARVEGPSGAYREKPGTLLAKIDRERNKKALYATLKGEVEAVNSEVAGSFVEAGTRLMTIRHYLSRDEVVDRLLKKTLYLFLAPEKAKYYFVPDIDAKIKASGMRAVQVAPGQELFIMSRMKREAPVAYDGPPGRIYSVYFSITDNVEAGEPLIGVCPPDQIEMISEVVTAVQSEWKEPS